MTQTDRERSFIAQLTAETGTLGFFSELHDVVPLDPYPAFSWVGVQASRLGHMIGYSAEPRNVTPLRLYFRYNEHGYKLFVRSARYYRATIGFKDRFLGAFSAQEDEHRELFSIQWLEGPPELPAQPDSLLSCHLIARSTGNPLSVCRRRLQLNVGGRRHPAQYETFTGTSADGASPLKLHLQILQTNVPYLDNPDEV
ncbi:TPA: hypothetical protein QEM96_000282 [Pseudomonas putida]|nr:hypothetical protein [Pseudomonas putida]